MSKRRRVLTPRTPTAFTEDQKRTLYVNIDKLEARAVEAMVDRPFTYDDVMAWLFPAPIRDVCRAAFGKVITYSDLAPYPYNFNGQLVILHVRSHNILLPIVECMEVDVDHVMPLEQAIQQTSEIVQQFNLVRDLVGWMNERATPGAVRYYAPALLSLLPPDNTPLFKASGERYKEPKGLSEKLPILRDVAAIVAQALLLPEPTEKRETKITYRLVMEGLGLTSKTFPLV